MRIQYTIRSLIIGKTSEATMSYMTRACPALENVEFTQDLDNFQDCSYAFAGNYSLKFVSFDNLILSNCTDFTEMFSGCSHITTIPLLDTSSGTNFSYMFYYCQSLTSVPLLDTSSGTDISQMFTGCGALATIPNLDWSNDTNDGYTLYGNFTKILVTFGEFDITINCNLDRENIVTVFDNLPETLLSPTIYLNGNPGAPELTLTDIDIATDKGWTVTTGDQF